MNALHIFIGILRGLQTQLCIVDDLQSSLPQKGTYRDVDVSVEVLVLGVHSCQVHFLDIGLGNRSTCRTERVLQINIDSIVSLLFYNRIFVAVLENQHHARAEYSRNELVPEGLLELFKIMINVFSSITKGHGHEWSSSHLSEN